MRDDRSAETIQRLLDDLERLLSTTRDDVDVDGKEALPSAITATGLGRVDNPLFQVLYRV